MLDAGRRSLFAFDSKRTRPVSRDATFIPTIACANSGFCSMSEIRACNSARVCVVLATLTAGEACGLGTGLAIGLAIGLGAGIATDGALTFRSREGCCCPLVIGPND